MKIEVHSLLLGQLAEKIFRDALGQGIWLSFMDGKIQSPNTDPAASVVQYKDVKIFHQLEQDGVRIDLPWDKVTTLFNQARLYEQLHDTERASLLYRLIIFKVSLSLSPVFLC